VRALPLRLQRQRLEAQPGPRGETRPGRVFPTDKWLRHGDDWSVAVSVLIVDDDAVFRTLARRVLAASGLHLIAEAASVADALSTAESVKPAGALVDIGLPDGDGFELARQLTALPWRPRVVLMSVESDAASIDEVRDSGAQTFVHKADLPGAPLARLLGAE
jgi:DNA-binding NarL/FixJ family response regulator